MSRLHNLLDKTGLMLLDEQAKKKCKRLHKGRPIGSPKEVLLDRFDARGVLFGHGMKCKLSFGQLVKLDDLIQRGQND